MEVLWVAGHDIKRSKWPSLRLWPTKIIKNIYLLEFVLELC